jgi:(5-formylfuran-3-yl)methyl phosphate synthase
MTGLLVSVRNTAEAELALAGGADVIDIKEPSRGALGAADPDVWREVQRVVGNRAIVSAALGELLDGGLPQIAAETRGLRFAKIGLAGCHVQRGWLKRWFESVSALPFGVQPVPVAYADWPAADAPSPSVAMSLAMQSPARLLLIDTHDKTHGCLLDHLCIDSLRELAQLARESHVRLVLAGSLDATSIDELLPLAPAYVGVRGAVCRGGREGTVDAALVKSLAQQVRAPARKAAG